SIENRIPYIQSGAIEKMPNPSFGFGIDKRYRIFVGLEYDNINFNNKEKVGKGQHNLVVHNWGVDENNKHLIGVWAK
ncbi:MAG: hypothetical protein KAI53_03680, partial [Candidatus Aenigmarchaeota archaeon]|nr:hypothetical protein [Candidatus Aenigmarchaeota archaeon]